METNTPFAIEYHSETSELTDNLKEKLEKRLQKLAKRHHDITGASLSVDMPSHDAAQYTIYRVRLVVYQRPGQHCQVSGELAAYKENAVTEQLSQLQQAPAGKLFFLNGLQVNAASSEIRKKLHLNDNIAELLPTTVSQYIAQHHLYQTDE